MFRTKYRDQKRERNTKDYYFHISSKLWMHTSSTRSGHAMANALGPQEVQMQIYIANVSEKTGVRSGGIISGLK